jgi:transposase
MTLLAALRLDGVAAGSILPGAADAVVFGSFIRTAVLPVLRPGDVVVWDNLSSHRVDGLEDEIHAVEAELRLLPPYSPDFTPIEQLWSKVKQFLRKAEPRSPTALVRATRRGLASVTQEDIRGWFAKCGYCVH